MTNDEFIAEIRRGLITIMRAMMRKYRMKWLDFFPKDPIIFEGIPDVVDVTEREG